MLKKIILPATLGAMLLPSLAMANGDMKMSMSQALDKLKAGGYSNIRDIERHNDYYHVRIYDQNCQGHHLRVMADGNIKKGIENERHPTSYDRVSALTIANTVTHMGYKDIEEIDLEFDTYHVKAKNSEGHSERLRFNAISGKEVK